MVVYVSETLYQKKRGRLKSTVMWLLFSKFDENFLKYRAGSLGKMPYRSQCRELVCSSEWQGARAKEPIPSTGSGIDGGFSI